jgi:hypothetical protein
MTAIVQISAMSQLLDGDAGHVFSWCFGEFAAPNRKLARDADPRVTP